MKKTVPLGVDKKVAGVWGVHLGDWDPALETGMDLIDRQHHALFDQIRALIGLSKGDRIQGTLEFLAACSAEHFGTEEYLHRMTNYPRAGEHLDMHNRFTSTFGELRAEYDASGQRHAIIKSLTRFLVTWLMDHIQVEDHQFTDYFHRLRPCAVIASHREDFTHAIGGRAMPEMRRRGVTSFRKGRRHQ